MSDFSQIDFDHPEVQTSLARLYAVLIERANEIEAQQRMNDDGLMAESDVAILSPAKPSSPGKEHSHASHSLSSHIV